MYDNNLENNENENVGNQRNNGNNMKYGVSMAMANQWRNMKAMWRKAIEGNHRNEKLIQWPAGENICS